MVGARVGNSVAAFAMERLGVRGLQAATTLLGRRPDHGAPGGGPIPAETLAALLEGLAADGIFAEIDLLLKLPGQRAPWAIEIKRGLAPKIERGFHLACDDVRPGRRLVVYSGAERFPLAEAVEAVALVDLCEDLAAA